MPSSPTPSAQNLHGPIGRNWLISRILFPFLSLLALHNGVSKAQTPPWYFINTGIANSHIILFLDTVPLLINGVPLAVGDYIGAFYYDEFGNLKCGTGTGMTGDVGGMRWEGQTAAAATWGTEPNVYNGFQTGELMKWRVWRASDGSQFDAQVTYIIGNQLFPDSGFYLPNGISAIASLEAFSIPGVDLSVNKMLSPISGCSLYDTAQVTIVIQNHDTIPATGFYLSISVNGADTLHYLYTDVLQPNATDTFTFPEYYDFSALGFYSFYLKVTASGDVNPTNDHKEPWIENRLNPLVSIGNDTAFCQGGWTRFYSDPVYPGMLWSDGSADSALFVNTGGMIYLTVTDDLGCQGVDSALVTLWDLPKPNLGPDTSFCAGRYILLNFPLDFVSYSWNNGGTTSSLYTSNPGSFILSVTDTNGCIGKDTLFIAEVSPPQPNLGPNISTLNPDTLLDAGPGFDSYLWQDGSTNQSFQVTEYGEYSVTVSLTGCTGTDQIRISEAEDPGPGNQIEIIPNPSGGLIPVVFRFPNEGTALIDIFDALGRPVLTLPVEQLTKLSLSPGFLGSGVYTIRVRTGGIRLSKKFVIL